MESIGGIFMMRALTRGYYRQQPAPSHSTRLYPRTKISDLVKESIVIKIAEEGVRVYQ